MLQLGRGGQLAQAALDDRMHVGSHADEGPAAQAAGNVGDPGLDGEGHVQHHGRVCLQLPDAGSGAAQAHLFLHGGQQQDLRLMLAPCELLHGQDQGRQGGAVVQGPTRTAPALQALQRAPRRDDVAHAHGGAHLGLRQADVDEELVRGQHLAAEFGTQYMRRAGADDARQGSRAQDGHRLGQEQPGIPAAQAGEAQEAAILHGRHHEADGIHMRREQKPGRGRGAGGRCGPGGGSGPGGGLRPRGAAPQPVAHGVAPMAVHQRSQLFGQTVGHVRLMSAEARHGGEGFQQGVEVPASVAVGRVHGATGWGVKPPMGVGGSTGVPAAR